MGFDWKLADHIIDLLSVKPGQTVLDPFCGAGTTLVQCKKRGIDSIGLDVNPVCTLATSVKTTWNLDPRVLERKLESVIAIAENLDSAVVDDGANALAYLKASGMIDRGWLTLYKARKTLALRSAIRSAGLSIPYTNFFHLALISAIVTRIADIKFGPEVYVLKRPRHLPVVASFVGAAMKMIADLRYARQLKQTSTQAKVLLADSRAFKDVSTAAPNRVDFIITSPPYPNEHDYTRSTRLELVFLDHVSDVAALRKIKRQMVRCSTKGVYKDDSDSSSASEVPSVERVAQQLKRRALEYNDGFSRLSERMVREYFGGMTNHLAAIAQILKPGGACAYVVRDSQSLLGVYIDTPGILAEIATHQKLGLVVDELVEWKRVRGTTGIRTLSEKIVMLRKSTR